MKFILLQGQAEKHSWDFLKNIQVFGKKYILIRQWSIKSSRLLTQWTLLSSFRFWRDTVS